MIRFIANLGPLLFGIAILNFAIFFVVALIIGGDAINGKVQDGRYFVANHGEFTEVPHAVWTYSYCHAISVFVTHPLGILSIALFSRLRTKDQEPK